MVNKGDKIGLVGKNGAGKSTLLKILASEINPKSGNISVPKGLEIGFLRQDLDFAILHINYARFLTKQNQNYFVLSHHQAL